MYVYLWYGLCGSGTLAVSAADFEEIESVDMEKEDLGFIPVEDLNTSVEQTIAEEEINTSYPEVFLTCQVPFEPLFLLTAQ